MQTTVLILCTAVHCAVQTSDIRADGWTPPSPPQTIQVAAKKKCREVSSKAQCTKRKNCHWVGKAQKCIAK